MKSSPTRRPPRLLYSLAAAVLMSVGAMRSAEAQIPVTDVASLMQQILGYLQVINQYETQIRQYQTQIQQYENMVQNTAQLVNGGSWTNIQSALAGINSILTNGQSIAAQSGNLNAQFAALFPAYTTLLNSQISLSTQQNSYQSLSANTQNAFESAILAARTIKQNSPTDQDAIGTLQNQARSTGGNLQALQSVASIGV